MAGVAFEQLRALVLADEALQNELFAERDQPAFVSSLVAIAAEHGINVTDMDIWQELSNGRTVALSMWAP
jgi:hypothetical protein